MNGLIHFFYTTSCYDLDIRPTYKYFHRLCAEDYEVNKQVLNLFGKATTVLFKRRLSQPLLNIGLLS